MVDPLDDTSPIRVQVPQNAPQNARRPPDDGGVPAPPRLLLWLIVGLFVLAIIGAVGGVVVFRSVLRPGQQQRVIGILPFMEAFLPAHNLTDSLPTPVPGSGSESGISTLDLLSGPLDIGADTEATSEVTDEAESDNEATDEPLAVGLALTLEVEEPPVEAAVIAPSPTSLPPTSAPSLTPTATIAATSTQPPTDIPQAAAISTPIPIAGVALDAGPNANPPAARLYGFTHVRQTWNNCGPANITMTLSYYGWREGQDVAASYLKPEREDKNVNPGEIVNFVNSYTGVRAITRIGGDMQLLKTFLASNFPVIVETGYMPEGYDWIGHYQTVVGYSDYDQLVYIYDSYLGAGENGEGIAESYADFDENWQHFNRTFIVVYDQEREGRVREILADRADLAGAAQRAYDIAQSEARTNPQDWAPWFNMGTALVRLGRYEEAAVAYDQARQLDVPWRMLWYQFGPYEAYFNIGRYDDVMQLTEINIASSQGYVEETYYWQGRVLAQQGERQQAANLFNIALARNPFYTAAEDALQQL